MARSSAGCAVLLRDKRGVSAVEFAMLLPLMVTLYLGGVEVSQGIAIDRKVTLTARTLGDLVVAGDEHQQRRHDQHPQRRGRGHGALSDYANLKVTVSSVKIDANGIAKVDWSDT